MTSTSSNLDVANEILRQLGGNRFKAMTGANLFVGGGNYLTFKLPRSKDNANRVRITLTSDDLYTIETYRVHGLSLTPKSVREFVYADQLQEVFTAITGLYTSL